MVKKASEGGALTGAEIRWRFSCVEWIYFAHRATGGNLWFETHRVCLINLADLKVMRA